jgi:hypothetical protein
MRLVANILEHPDGIAISAAFIAVIMVISLISRVSRTTELRADRIEFDDLARSFVTASLEHDQKLTLIANRRQVGDKREYDEKEEGQRSMNPVPGAADVLFLEIDVTDPSEFSGVLKVRGVEVDGHRVLRAEGPAVPNALSAILLARRPHHDLPDGEGLGGGAQPRRPRPRTAPRPRQGRRQAPARLRPPGRAAHPDGQRRGRDRHPRGRPRRAGGAWSATSSSPSRPKVPNRFQPLRRTTRCTER